MQLALRSLVVDMRAHPGDDPLQSALLPQYSTSTYFSVEYVQLFLPPHISSFFSKGVVNMIIAISKRIKKEMQKQDFSLAAV